jgi:hypothetical protein
VNSFRRRTSTGMAMVACNGKVIKAPPCYRDNRPATIRCDQIVGQRDAGIATVPVTCCRWCCDNVACSVKVGPNKHLCRQHYDAAGGANAVYPGGGTTP